MQAQRHNDLTVQPFNDLTLQRSKNLNFPSAFPTLLFPADHSIADLWARCGITAKTEACAGGLARTDQISLR
jgi:hypothetical protein